MEPPVRPLGSQGRLLLRIALGLAWLGGVIGALSSGWTLSYFWPGSPRPVHTETSPSATAPSISAVVATSASAAVSTTAAPALSVASAGPAIAAASAVGTSSSEDAKPAASAEAAQAGPRMPTSDEQFEIAYDALDHFKRTHLPLSAANFVLSLALVAAVARTVTRRPGAKSWLQQLCVASALFALTEYALSRGERRYIEDRISAMQPALGEATDIRAVVAARWLIGALAEVALFGGLAIALSSPGVILELAPGDRSAGSPPPPRDPREGDDDE